MLEAYANRAFSSWFMESKATVGLFFSWHSLGKKVISWVKSFFANDFEKVTKHTEAHTVYNSSILLKKGVFYEQ